MGRVYAVGAAAGESVGGWAFVITSAAGVDPGASCEVAGGGVGSGGLTGLAWLTAAAAGCGEVTAGVAAGEADVGAAAASVGGGNKLTVPSGLML